MARKNRLKRHSRNYGILGLGSEVTVINTRRILMGKADTQCEKREEMWTKNEKY